MEDECTELLRRRSESYDKASGKWLRTRLESNPPALPFLEGDF
jgi:hypothetical protein